VSRQRGAPKSTGSILDYGLAKRPSVLHHILFSRLCLLCCGLLLFLLTAVQLYGSQTLVFLSVLFTDGAVAAAWIAGACALGWVILRRFKLDTNGALSLATAGGLGLGIFSLIGLGLGLLGWLDRPVAIAFPIVSLLFWIADYFQSRSTPAPRYAEEPGQDSNLRQWLLTPAGASWLWLVPVVSLTIALMSASMMPGILWKPLDPHPYDVTGYHLLVPREWYEGGRIVPLEHNVYSFFEFNVEMQFLLLMHAMGGPWAAMYACQFVCVGYAGLMVLAVVGASALQQGEHRTSNIEHPTSKSEPCSVRRSMFDVRCSMFPFSSILAAALATTVPWVIMLAGVAYVESALMLYTALAIAWAMYAIRRPDQLVRSLLLSGILAGFACGVKITAVPMLLLAVPVGTFTVLIIRRPIELPVKRVMLGCAALLLAGSVVVSPWLIRNCIWAGNPLFPVGMKALGRNHFDDVQVKRFHDAHSPTANLESFTAKINLLCRDVIGYWQFGYFILPAGLIACLLRWRDRQSWLIFVCGAFVLVVWIGFTHLLPRFLVMLIPIAAIAIGRVQWGRAWPAGVALLLVAAVLAWSKVIPELTRQPAVIGVEDLSQLLPPELSAQRDGHMQIGLVGDAQAFLYQIPLSRMHYRAVFNLHTGTDDPVQAWLGTEPIGNPNWLLMINPTEIERLHDTYYGVPALPPDWAPHGSADFFVRGDQLRKR
jgi:hypothetical protein